ncbi:MAG: hypothetical protein HC810_02505 [Acaryochloridaceae cyanobacterium RL_2_7]|nr:hypothetical protein [Acaryochloridaceae cyanobacterium RL_2_7]
MSDDSKAMAKALRFKFYNELEESFRRICDEVASSEMKEGDIARLAQLVVRSRHACLKLLVPSEEMDEYYEQYPEVDES